MRGRIKSVLYVYKESIPSRKRVDLPSKCVVFSGLPAGASHHAVDHIALAVLRLNDQLELCPRGNLLIRNVEVVEQLVDVREPILEEGVVILDLHVIQLSIVDLHNSVQIIYNHRNSG